MGAFIDWNSQLRAAPSHIDDNPVSRARWALKWLGKSLTKILCAEIPEARFRVSLRVYHGWTKGFTWTENYIALSSLPEMLDLDGLFPSARVSVISDIGFGHRLIEAQPQREYRGSGVHLYNTLRQQGGPQRYQEKMVDTALACDLLSWVRSEPSGWALVVSNDDDIVPPAFVAEAWAAQLGGTVMLLRSRDRCTDQFLQLEGLVRAIQ